MKRKYMVVLGSLLFLVIILVLGRVILAPQLKALITPPNQGVGPLPVQPATGPSDGYGLYESCSPNEPSVCLSHLNTMAAAGFKLVIDYDQLSGDAAFQKTYLDHAQSVGMKVIVSFSDPDFYNGSNLRSDFPALAATCECNSNEGFITYAVSLVKNNPALWGYYIGDEVDASDHDQMKTDLADVVHQADPNHPRLFIDNPGHSVSVWHGNSPFYDTAEVIGTDFYPIRDNSPGYPTLEQTGEVAAGVQAYADAHNEGSAMVLQAFSYSNYDIPGQPYPTVAQMKYMLSQTLANSHPRLILWYSYYDTMSSNDATQHWDDLKSLIAPTS
ncbi:MAG TPA: hypothetical protein VL485_24950 [Ktedonobacteraceae bacterium]|nr:hypothetical protein [Ktedonobacteraceae bacterium]